jgi:hypothetical protein
MGLPSALRPRAFWRRAEAFAQAGRRAAVCATGGGPHYCLKRKRKRRFQFRWRIDNDARQPP